MQSWHPVHAFIQGVLDVAHAFAFTPNGKILVSGSVDG